MKTLSKSQGSPNKRPQEENIKLYEESVQQKVAGGLVVEPSETWLQQQEGTFLPNNMIETHGKDETTNQILYDK